MYWLYSKTRYHFRFVIGVAVLSVNLGCQSYGAHPAPKTSLHADFVAISGGAMQSGFANGTLRAARTLKPFQISQHPVTWGEYEACLRGGGCAPADTAECTSGAYRPHPGFVSPDYALRSDNAPAICVGQEQAEAYCKASGGRLPTLDEWQLAVRGASPKRYSWGDSASACDQHPLVPQILSLRRAEGATLSPALSTCEDRAFDGSELHVLTHHAGRAESGLEDALLAPGELLAADRENAFTACGGSFRHCVVFGTEPGAIESVETFLETPKPPEKGAGTQPAIEHAYAFRCVLDASK